MSETDIAASYSDEALTGAITQLRNADYLGLWGKKRLEKAHGRSPEKKP